MTRGPNARTVALECLLAVERDDAYANIVLPPLLRKAALEPRDAALATELAYGALRMRGLYDAVIAHASGRDPATLEVVVRAALWLGAHQVLAMRVPPHAAVDQTVTLAREAGAAKASGLVNAVMRRITEASVDSWMARVAPGRSRADLAVRHSHPEWIVAALDASLAADGRAGEIEQALAIDNRAPKVHLVARPGLTTRDAVLGETEGTPTRLSPYGIVLASGDPGALVAVRDGAAAAQDEGSQLAALALAAATLEGPDARWLDMCAGPGGKTALLGAIATGRNATIDALELHEHRTTLILNAVRALPQGVVTAHTADATAWVAAPYDRILLDAPCTGLGAMRRRPESRWRRTPADLKDLTRLQTSLLGRAADLVRPGGVVAYVTCSPVLAETREVIAASGLRELDARVALTAATGVDQGWGTKRSVQLWTHAHGTDSMFIALLTRD